MNVGVLALQGDFREHISALGDCGVTGKLVKTVAEISAVDALIIPGGESTTISKLAKAFGLFDLISKRISEGKASLAISISKNLVESKGLDAGKIIRELAKEVQGGGGGQPFLATAGGQNPAGITKLLSLAPSYIA